MGTDTGTHLRPTYPNSVGTLVCTAPLLYRSKSQSTLKIVDCVISSTTEVGIFWIVAGEAGIRNRVAKYSLIKHPIDLGSGITVGNTVPGNSAGLVGFAVWIKIILSPENTKITAIN